jgi:hypothetical protein
VVSIWEGEFNRVYPGAREKYMAKHMPAYMHRYKKSNHPERVEKFLSCESVSEAVKTDELFGFVEVDVECQAPSAFPGLFYKRAGVPHNGYAAKCILLHTPYLATLLRHGYTVSHVHRVWAFERGRPFAKFVDWAVEERRKGNSTAKLLVNSLYGGTILNKRNYVQTRCTTNDLTRGALVMDASFRDLEWLGGPAVHIFSDQSTVNMDTPSHVGKAVLDLAKARMVDFYHDVIEKVGGVLISMDTDAFTFHVPVDMDLTTLPLSVREAYFDQPHDPVGSREKVGTPGLFHLESIGTSARVLGPKCLCVVDRSQATKVTCKGVKRSALPSNPFDLYESIQSGIPHQVSFPSTQSTGGCVKRIVRHKTIKVT